METVLLYYNSHYKNKEGKGGRLMTETVSQGKVALLEVPEHLGTSSAGNVNADMRYGKPKPEVAAKCCQQLFN